MEKLEEQLKNELISTINECYKIYAYKPTSGEKVNPLHWMAAEKVEKGLGKKYIAHADKYKNRKEVVTDGFFHPKKLDVTIETVKNNNYLGGLEVKFPCSSIRKNENNNFQGLSGECMNIKMAGKIFSCLLVIPVVRPNYTKDGIIKSVEYFHESDLEKYIKFAGMDVDTSMSPASFADSVCIVLIDPGNEKFLKEHLDQKVTPEELIDSFNVSIIDPDDTEYLESEKYIKNYKELSDMEEFFRYICAKAIVENK